MTDQPQDGSELEPEQRLPVPRPPVEPAPVERFTSPPSTRSVELSPERAAQVVRQSSNARWVGFLAVVVVILFITLYWFYELAPLGFMTPRLDADAAQQQITSVERGYNLYEANCARCHGVDGLGPNDTPPGIGPALNSQEKLYAHLSVDYLNNMMVAGGRFACGNPNSIMPVWSNQGHPPGPLNYIQIEDLIAFIRAPNTQTYTIRDPELGEPRLDPVTKEVRTFTGWVDVNYKPAPGSTPFPACWSDAFASPSGAPSGAPAASVDPNATVVDIKAAGFAFDPNALTGPADKAFVLKFDNQDAGVPHNIEIKDSAGAIKFTGETFNGVATKDYQVPALAAGSYPFLCTVHPTMTGTLTIQ
jgi:mono/diheme cytochrome c family protein/plastocyanin